MLHTVLSDQDRTGLLETLGCSGVAELFAEIGLTPLTRPTEWPSGCSELEAAVRLRRLAAASKGASDRPCFLGGGIYRHFIPGVVEDIASKQEFWTTHLPWYPEIFQGFLCAQFEYQSLIARLTALKAACCPVGGPGEALAGAVLAVMKRHPEGGRVLVAQTVNPLYLNQARWMLRPFPVEFESIGFQTDGSLDLAALNAGLASDTVAVVVQCPNHFGLIENMPALAELVRFSEAVLIEVIAEALSLGVISPPGELGFDLACGDLTSLGLPLSGEGAGAGFVASTEEFKDALPGRLVAETEDMEGFRVFVDLTDQLTYARRWRGLFSHNMLAGIRVAAYLALLGGAGIHRAALLSHQKARLAREKALERGLVIPTGREFFNEFPLRLCCGPARLNQALDEAGFLGGLPLDGETYLFAFTEINRDEDVVRLMDVLGGLT